MKNKSAPLTSSTILQYMSSLEGRISRRELAKAFNIKGDDRVILKSLLKEMTVAGDLLKIGKSYELPAAKDIVTLKVVEEDSDCYIACLENALEETDATKIIIPKDKYLKVKGTLSPNDLVVAKLYKVSERTYRAEIIRQVSSASRAIVGVFFGTSSHGGEVEPTHRGERQIFKIPSAKTMGAEDGDIVRISILDGAPGHPGTAQIIERLGSIKQAKSLSLIAIHTYNLPVKFQEKSVELANKAKIPSLQGRTDLRHIPLVTIDDEDARDFDDAVFAEPDTDPDNKNGWHLIVAIADVSHYVLPGSPLDSDAYERGNSVYFPDQVIPMLPEALSNGLCSLKPNEDRGCLAVHMWIDARGALKRFQFVHGLMRSAYRLTYKEVQAIQEGATDVFEDKQRIVKNLYAAYATLEKERSHREPLDLELPEKRVVIDDKGIVQSIIERARLDSHKLIEEFMILANVVAAKHLEQKNHLCLYRVHEHPTLEKIDSLREFLKGSVLSLAKGQVFQPKHFNQLIRKAKDTEFEKSIHTLVLRTQAQAVYDPDNIGHFGLNLRTYCHFTSPIRRYADLLVHRALVDTHKFSSTKLFNYSPKQFKNIAEHISLTERQAAVAERDTTDRYVSSFLYNRVGETFKARVSGVTKFALFVSFEGTGADAILPLRLLKDDYYTFDEISRSVIGERSGQVYRIGDALEVILEQCNPFTGQMLVRLAHTANSSTPRSHHEKKRTPHTKKPGKNRAFQKESKIK